jgi:hypothetical protein
LVILQKKIVGPVFTDLHWFFGEKHITNSVMKKERQISLLYIYNADTDKAVGQLMMLTLILGPKNIWEKTRNPPL